MHHNGMSKASQMLTAAATGTQQQGTLLPVVSSSWTGGAPSSAANTSATMMPSQLEYSCAQAACAGILCWMAVSLHSNIMHIVVHLTGRRFAHSGEMPA
jgi:hypothetical protein